MQFALHAHELLGLGLGELEHRNAGGLGNHLSDDVLIHHHLHIGLALTPSGFLLLALGLDLLLLVTQLGGLLKVLVLDGLVLLLGQLGSLGVQFLELRRSGEPADTQSGAGLIDQIDGLVGQVAVLNVAAGKFRRGLQRTIGDRHMMVVLVTLTQALQNLNGLGDGRLVHLDRLETTFQRGILLDVLAVLVGGGRADGLQFATGQHRLQHIGSAQGAIRGACAHDGVNLIDEQHDVAAGLDLLQNLLQAFLEIATVAGTSNHGTEVQGVDLLAFQRFRHITGVDLLRESFDHRGLAYARLADQHRVVLGAATQHHHHTLDLVGSSDHRIELPSGSLSRKVAAELVENRGTGLIATVLHATGIGEFALAIVLAVAGIASDQIDGSATQFAKVDIHLDQHLCADAFALMNQTEQDMLGADIAVPQLQRLT